MKRTFFEMLENAHAFLTMGATETTSWGFITRTHPSDLQRVLNHIVSLFLLPVWLIIQKNKISIIGLVSFYPNNYQILRMLIKQRFWAFFKICPELFGKAMLDRQKDES